MILFSTSPYALLKEFSIACGFKYDAVFRVCLNNLCDGLSENIYYVNFRRPERFLKINISKS